MYIILLCRTARPQLFPYLPISDKKAQVLLPLGQKALQTIQALTYMRNSPALSLYTTIQAKPVSLPCSIQLFFNLLESLLCSPQKNSSCEWCIFSYSGGMCHQSQYPNQIAVEGSILFLWSDGSNWPQEQNTEMLSLTTWGLFSLLWLSNWLCCMLENMHFELLPSG